MNIQHALEIADEGRDGGYTSHSSEALSFLADHIRKINVADLQKQLAVAKESAEYAWRNARILEAA